MKKILTILLVLNFTSCNKKDYLLDIAKGMNKEDAIKTWDKIYDLNELVLMNFNNYNYILMFNEESIVESVEIYKENTKSIKNKERYFSKPEKITIKDAIRKFSFPDFASVSLDDGVKYYELNFSIDNSYGYSIKYEYTNYTFNVSSVVCSQLNK